MRQTILATSFSSYLNEHPWNERARAIWGDNTPDSKSNAVFSVADELSKLAALKAQGVLTEEEFNKQKLKLLS
jgi:putative oligomerization/nucleic acid binding protein